MKRILIILGIVLATSFAANAQYNGAIGLRGGLTGGITYKQMMGGSALEFIGSTGYRYNGVNLTVLFERQQSLGGVSGLYWFYGFGGHVGYWDVSLYNNPDYVGTQLVVGADAIIGLEYVIPGFPISVSADWKPGFNLIGHRGFRGDNGALSLRYTF